MGREIKFRAWDKEDKRIFVGHSVGISISGVIAFLDIDGEWKDGNGRIELIQYTGLKDKNGKDIYEQDILKVDFNGTEFLCVVVWLKGLCSFRVIQYIDGKKEYDDLNTVYSKRCEIIGNIYENPELLK